jgi:predicted porin
MQKKIIALAVAAVASGAAFAQTNVTISGTVNYELENISASNASGSFAAATAPGNRSALEGRSRVNENGSELKFTVTEDLGNGLKAGVTIASGVQPTDSNSSASGSPSLNGSGISNVASRGGLGGRDTFISLGGNFGTIKMGRQSFHYTTQGKIDDFASGGALAGSTGGIFTGVGGTDPSGARNGSITGTGTNLSGYGYSAGSRFSNSLTYTTPSFSGFTALFGYARPNSSASNPDGVFNTSGTVQRKESAWNVKLDFENGPMYAYMSYVAQNDISMKNTGIITYNSLNSATQTGIAAVNCPLGSTGVTLVSTAAACTVNTGTATAGTTWDAEVRGLRTGASYTFGNGLKVGLIYDNTKFLAKDDSGPATNGDFTSKRSAWAIPVSWTFGPHKVGGTYGKANNIQVGGSLSTGTRLVGGTITNSADFNATGATFVMAGYQYAFSKRTNIGVTFARIDNDARAGYDFFQNAAAGITANTRGSDPTSVSIGMKHSF